MGILIGWAVLIALYVLDESKMPLEKKEAWLFAIVAVSGIFVAASISRISDKSFWMFLFGVVWSTAITAMFHAATRVNSR